MSDLYWHVHHDVLIEYCYDAEERITYIESSKPPEEVETRLRLMKPVQGMLGGYKLLDEGHKLLAEGDKLLAEGGKLWAEGGKLWDEGGKLWDEGDKLLAESNKLLAEWRASCTPGEIEALHALECPNCPWDGKTIFPEAKP